MANAERSGNVWYAVKNIFMAIMFGILAVFIGPTAAIVGIIVVYVLGIATIISGFASLGETDIKATIASIVFGVLIIVIGNMLMKWDWFKAISLCLGAGFVVYIGRGQRRKLRERYGDGTSLEKLLKVFARLVHYPLFFGGILMLVGTIINFVLLFVSISVLATVSNVLLIVGAVLCGIAAICWIIYTIMVLRALNESGRTINSFKRGKRSSGAPSSSGRTHAVSGGANESKVRATMNSVASYYNGGFDYPYKGMELHYSVSVSVNNGNITFTLTYKISGSCPQESMKYARDNAISMINKRQKLILNDAENKLNGLKPDRDYSIYVNLSGN